MRTRIFILASVAALLGACGSDRATAPAGTTTGGTSGGTSGGTASGSTGGGTPNGGGASGASDPFRAPDPLTVRPTLDAAHAASDSIPLGGSTLVARAADGTVYRLTVPATALVAPVRITMTPIVDVAGAGLSGGRWLGVDLQPHGLRFMAPLSLAIEPPSGGAVPAAGYAYGADGSDFHGFALVKDRTHLAMNLLHFSGALAYVGDGISIPVAPAHQPVDVEAQIEQAIGDIVNAKRQQELRGQPGDPEWASKVEQLLHLYYDKVIAGKLSRMGTDCAFAHEWTGKALGFARTTQLMFAGKGFEAENDAVMQTLLVATENCLAETLKPCLDWGNQAQVQRALAYERQLQLLGSDRGPSVFDAATACGALDGWVRSTTAIDAGAVKLTLELSATPKFQLDQARSTGSARVYTTAGGTVTWKISAEAAGCTWSGGPVTSNINPGDGQLVVTADGAASWYAGTAQSRLGTGTLTVTCDGKVAYEVPYGGNVYGWMEIPGARRYTVASGSGALAGSFTNATGTVFDWNLTLSKGGGVTP